MIANHLHFAMNLMVITITGDLRIVKNRKLRCLLSKGPKYREENTIDWDLNKKYLNYGSRRSCQEPE